LSRTRGGGEVSSKEKREKGGGYRKKIDCPGRGVTERKKKEKTVLAKSSGGRKKEKGKGGIRKKEEVCPRMREAFPCKSASVEKREEKVWGII